MDKWLKGRKALVTGAADRIGRAISLSLAERGADLVVHYNTNKDKAELLANELKMIGAKASAIQADFTEFDSLKSLATESLCFLGSLDFLINNASSWPEPSKLEAKKSILEEDLAGWEQSLNVNTRAPFFLIQYLAEALAESGGGRVINILDSSISKPYLSRAAHSISKIALLAVNDIAEKTFQGSISFDALELTSIIPQEEMEKEEQGDKIWLGEDWVVREVLKLLK